MRKIFKVTTGMFFILILIFSVLTSEAKADKLADKDDWKVNVLALDKVSQNYNTKTCDESRNNNYVINEDNIVDMHDSFTMFKKILEDVKHGNTSSNLINGGVYCERGGWIYYNNWLGNGELCKVKTDGTERTKVSNKSAHSISVVKGCLYYINPYVKTINRMNTDGSNDCLISSDSSTYMTVYGDNIVYRNDTERAMYIMKVDGSGKKLVTRDCPGDITISGQWIYYINYSDNSKPYKIQSDGTRSTKLSNISVDSLHFYDDKLYYISSNDHNIYVMNAYGSETSRICDNSVGEINISNGSIYYTSINENYALYKIDIDGKGKQKISDDKCETIHTCGNYIIYENTTDALSYSISKNKLEKNIFGFEVYVDDVNDNVLLGENYVLPDKLKGRFWLGGEQEDFPVTWDSSKVSTSTPGVYRYEGVVYGCNRIINLTLTVGIPQEVNYRINNISNGGYVTTKDGWTYYSNFEQDNDRGLYKVNADRTKRIKLFNNNVGYINVVGDSIYFTDNLNYICKMNTDGSDFKRLSYDSGVQIHVIGDYIYYIDFSYGSIIKMRTDGSEKARIGTDSTNRMVIYNNWIYYGSNHENGNSPGIIKMRLDGSEPTVLSTDEGGVINLNNGFIYYSTNTSPTSIIKMNLASGQKIVIKSGNLSSFNVQGEWIYYVNAYSLYKMKTDGTGVTKISNDSINSAIVLGDYIFYNKIVSDYTSKFIRMRTDGSEPVDFGVFIDHIDDISHNAYQGENYSLPKNVNVAFTDGSQQQLPITWTGDIIDTTKLGVYKFTGTVKGYWAKVNLQVNVVLPALQGNTTGNILNGGMYAQNIDWIYFTDDTNGSKLSKMKYDGSQKIVLSNDIPRYINVSNNFIYYCNASDGSKLYRMDTNGNEKMKLSEDMCSNLIELGDWLYYINDSEEIYKISINGTDKMKLAESSDITGFSIVNNEWIVYLDPNGGGAIYKVKIDGTSRTQLLDKGPMNYITNGNKIYYTTFGVVSSLFSMNIDGTDITKISDYLAGSLNIAGGYLYATKTWNLYKMNLITGVVENIYNGICASNIQIIDDWIYYYDSNEMHWCKIKTDGTGKQSL